MLMTTQRSGMTDVIIIGQGLVGSLLAIACQWAGLNALAIDNAHKELFNKNSCRYNESVDRAKANPHMGK